MLEFAIMGQGKKYPSVQARITEAQKARFMALLGEIQKRQSYMEPADLLRVFLGLDKRVQLTDRERAFMSGDVESIHGSYPAVPKPGTKRDKIGTG